MRPDLPKYTWTGPDFQNCRWIRQRGGRGQNLSIHLNFRHFGLLETLKLIKKNLKGYCFGFYSILGFFWVSMLTSTLLWLQSKLHAQLKLTNLPVIRLKLIIMIFVIKYLFQTTQKQRTRNYCRRIRATMQCHTITK